MRVLVVNYLGEDVGYLVLCCDVYFGLQKILKLLLFKWFYDMVGSELFDQIIWLLEYYLI